MVAVQNSMDYRACFISLAGSESNKSTYTINVITLSIIYGNKRHRHSSLQNCQNINTTNNIEEHEAREARKGNKKTNSLTSTDADGESDDRTAEEEILLHLPTFIL